MVFIRERCTLCTEKHKIQLAKTEKQTPNVRYFFNVLEEEKKTVDVLISLGFVSMFV